MNPFVLLKLMSTKIYHMKHGFFFVHSSIKHLPSCTFQNAQTTMSWQATKVGISLTWNVFYTIAHLYEDFAYDHHLEFAH